MSLSHRLPLSVSALLLVLLLVLLVALPWHGVDAMYQANSPVVALTADNFRRQVLQSEHLWFVEFYAPWCGHCQRFAPEYEKAAQNLKGIVKVGAVDCDAEKNKPLCGQYEVRGFPTIKIFPSKSYNGNKVPKDYQGAREARAVVDVALSEMPSFVAKVSAKNVDEFFDKDSSVPKALLFSSKSATTPLYKALSVDFHYRMNLGEVKSSETALVERFSVDKFPTLLVFPLGAETPVPYEGSLDHEKLSAFLATHALPPSKGGAEDSGSESKPKPAAKEEEPKVVEEEPFVKEVTHITSQEQLKEECLDRTLGICVIVFLGLEPDFPESVEQHNSNLQILETLKEKYHQRKSGLRFLWVDAFQQSSLMQKFGMSDILPGVLVLSPRRSMYRNYLGGFDEPQLSGFLDETLSGRGRSFKFDFEPTLLKSDD